MILFKEKGKFLIENLKLIPFSNILKKKTAKRYASGHHNVVKFLRKEGYLDYLNGEELEGKE